MDAPDIDQFIAAARQHGDDCGDSDAQVSDLEAYLRIAWQLMTEDQRVDFTKDIAVLDMFCNDAGEPL